MFALIDCNNFYVSCERLFNPSIWERPVVVLSNNDGCIVARSNEVKKLGVPMGAPLYQYQHLLKKHQTVIFSSNYQLYADLSARVMKVIQLYAPRLEIYSIDEAFVQLDGSTNCLAFAQQLQATIKQWVGIPVSIGIAPTKTLAKAANYIAKKNTQSGIYQCKQQQINRLLTQMPLEEIWGIGRNMLDRFKQMDIHTSLALKAYCPHQMQKQCGVIYQKMILELNGISCLFLEESQVKKNIISSRSFSYDVLRLETLEQAIANFASIAVAKARKQKSMVTGLTVFLKTNRFNKKYPQYSNSEEMVLELPTNDTGQLISAAKKLLRKIYQPGYRYKKAGIVLKGLIREVGIQQELFIGSVPPARTALMSLIDKINQEHGKGTLFFAAEGIDSTWMPNCNNRSPRYTTQWTELKTIKI